MKKVLNLVKSRKSSSSSTTKRGRSKSPSKGSLGQASSSLGGESASATSMVYESQRGRNNSQNAGDSVSPVELSSDRTTNPQSPNPQV